MGTLIDLLIIACLLVIIYMTYRIAKAVLPNPLGRPDPHTDGNNYKNWEK